MEWLQTLLNGVEGITDEQKVAITSGVNTEFPKHAVPKEQYSKKIAELEDAATQLTEAQKSITELSANGENSEELKEKLATITQSFEDYKANTDKRETDRSKKQSLTDTLIEAGMIPSAAKLYANTIELDKVMLDASGKIVDKDLLVNPIKETSKELFTTVTTEGTPPETGGTPPDNSKLSDEAYYKSLEKKE